MEVKGEFLPVTMQLLRDLRADNRVDMACSDQRPVNVLIVEDNQDDVYFMVETLQQVGCVVTVMKNGLDALKEIESNIGRYCIVFLDINLPGMDGVQVLQKAHKISPATHFIIVTGTDRICEIPNDCYYGVVRKPLHITTAVEIVTKLTQKA